MNNFDSSIKTLVKKIRKQKNKKTSQVLGKLSFIAQKNRNHNLAKSLYAKKLLVLNKSFYIDPFLGLEKKYIKISSDQLENTRIDLNSKGFEFIPSFNIEDDKLLNMWKYLIYIHIPKCAGTSFQKPIYLLKKNLIKYQSNQVDQNSKYHYLIFDNFTNSYESYGFLEMLNKLNLKNTKGIFISPHNTNWTFLYKKISQKLNLSPKIISTVRDPQKRLLSHLSHISIEHKNSLFEIINSNTIHFDNIIHRHIFDYGLIMDIKNKHQLYKSDIDLLNEINIVDYKDNMINSDIKSKFITASSLPNIVQFKKLNRLEWISQSHNKPTSKEISDAFDYCANKGYLKLDQQINFTSLKNESLKRINSENIYKYFENGIHPITCIIDENQKVRTLSTEEFLKNPTKAVNFN